MSSTNRGAVRAPDDFYATPGWAVRAVLPHLSLSTGSGRILEPSCGEGAIVRVLLDAGIDRQRILGILWLSIFASGLVMGLIAFS